MNRSFPGDSRYLPAGWEIPSQGYCDQPYVVVNEDGSWTCVLTTGTGVEGQPGQHVVSTRSTDQGRTWSALVDIEPIDGPEASWGMPLQIPSGRIYAFYTYNKNNLREVQADDPPFAGGRCKRVDSLGVYAYRYSDDMGHSWSSRRYEIPMRRFQIDKENPYGGEVLFFWGVGKPFLHDGAAYVCASKVGGFGKGFFTRNEGVLFRSDNLLTEPNPDKHVWETLPEGNVGLRAPGNAGPIAGEFNTTSLNDGSLYGSFRTIAGYPCHTYSRDGGRTWTKPEFMTYTPNGRKLKHPRAANFVRRFSNGKYLYWFHNHGGSVLAALPGIDNAVAYESRNPAWLCGGVEKDGYIHWSQPEIILYDDSIGERFSYPDFIEHNGRFYVTETQKSIARVHELDRDMLESMWRSVEEKDATVTNRALVLQWNDVEADMVDMPELALLVNRSTNENALIGKTQMSILPGSGMTLEFWIRFDDLIPWQVVFDSRDEEGKGILVLFTDRCRLKLILAGRCYGEPGGYHGAGLCESSWETDADLIEANRMHHIVFIVDGGPKIISVVVDGELCDGGKERQYGWGRFHPALRDVTGATQAKVASSLRGELKCLRIYNRYLLTSEAVANYRAGVVEGEAK